METAKNVARDHEKCCRAPRKMLPRTTRNVAEYREKCCLSACIQRSIRPRKMLPIGEDFPRETPKGAATAKNVTCFVKTAYLNKEVKENTERKKTKRSIIVAFFGKQEKSVAETTRYPCFHGPGLVHRFCRTAKGLPTLPAG